MEVSEFQHALHRGLGRAILHLQKHDSAPYRDVILQACLKNTTYDRQIEGGKLVYMTQVIELTGEKEYYRQHILDAARRIDENTDSYDSEHLLDLVQSFAQDGDSEARQIIYDAFANNPNNDAAAYHILELDGFDGFILVAEKLGQLAATDPLFSANDFLPTLEEQIGKSISDDKLAQVRRNNSRVDNYLNWVEAKRAARQLIKPQIKKNNPPYADIKQCIEMKLNENYLGWGRDADAEDLIQAARDLLNVLKWDDVPRLSKYLAIFWRRAFPLDPTPMLKLVDYPEGATYYPSLPLSTLIVLKQIAHPSVRELAWKLIAENRFTGQAIGLLNRNFETGDWQRIKEITEHKLDEHDYHSLELSVKEIFREHSTQEAAQTLLNLYENGICSHCRYDTVESLHSIDALPAAIREECLYDSYEDTRELAQRNFEPKVT